MSIADKLMTIAENEQLVANANAELEEALYSKSAGGKTYYDAYWDSYLDYGYRELYNHSFSWGGCTEATFKPNHDIRPIEAEYMFAYNGPSYAYCASPIIEDLEKWLVNLGVTLDFSQCTNINRVFYISSSFTALPEIDTTGTTELKALFYGCTGLRRIAKLKIRNDGTTSFSADVSWERTFFNCVSLEDLTIEGTIGNSVSFEWCPLTKASITSVVNALSATTAGKTLSLKKSAKEAAFTSAEWDALISTKSNWTISLV